MTETLTELSAAGILAFLIIDRVLKFLSAKKNGAGRTSATCPACVATSDQISELHEWHRPRQRKSDGALIFPWYATEATTILTRLVAQGDRQIELLEQLAKQNGDGE